MDETAHADDATGPIVFYDGRCGLCSRVVQWFVRRDRRKVLRFAPLQGKTAEQLLPPQEDDPLAWSIMLHEHARVYDKSNAAIRAAAHLGGMWRLTRSLLIVPRFLRDAMYGAIARRRYRWFGTHEACWLGDEHTRARFLP